MQPMQLIPKRHSSDYDQPTKLPVSFGFRCSRRRQISRGSKRHSALARFTTSLLVSPLLLLLGCKSDNKAASTLATQQVHALAAAAREDVMQIRRGLPVGAAEIAKLLPDKDEEVTPELV